MHHKRACNLDLPIDTSVVQIQWLYYGWYFCMFLGPWHMGAYVEDKDLMFAPLKTCKIDQNRPKMAYFGSYLWTVLAYRNVTPLYGKLLTSWVDFCHFRFVLATSGAVKPEKRSKIAILGV